MTLFCVTVGKDIMNWICVLVTSLGFPNFVFKIAFALSYPSVLKGRPSTRALTFGMTDSFKYENLLTLLCQLNLFPFQIGSRILTNLNLFLQSY